MSTKSKDNRTSRRFNCGTYSRHYIKTFCRAKLYAEYKHKRHGTHLLKIPWIVYIIDHTYK